MDLKLGNTSIWESSEKLTTIPSLDRDISADVCVVGAGIAGVTSAYLLMLEGKSVVLIDDGPIAGGETKHTTAHLSNVIDDRYHAIENVHGEGGAILAAQSHTAAIKFIESTVHKEHICCQFKQLDAYLYASTDAEEKEIEKENLAARRAGLLGIQKLSSIPSFSFNTGSCLKFPDQARFHPLQYVNGLLKILQKAHVPVFSGTRMVDLEGKGPIQVITQQGKRITAKDVIVATNTPVNDRFAIHTKQAPYRSYVIGALIPKGSVPDALYWDMQDPYHYVRLHELHLAEGQKNVRDYDVLIVGGEDHRTGMNTEMNQRHKNLEFWARDRFPMIKLVDFRWSGQVMETADGLAFLGRNPGDDHVYIITGDSGMGMTHGTIGALINADIIMGRENPWETLYNPSRKMVKSIGTYVKENIHGALNLAQHLTGGDVKSAEEISPNSGGIIREGIHKNAVYKDPNGGVHVCSAVCTHLGGVVQWNDEAKSWDCPFHGSRFKPKGEVLNGPAVSGLERKEENSRKSV